MSNRWFVWATAVVMVVAGMGPLMAIGPGGPGEKRNERLGGKREGRQLRPTQRVQTGHHGRGVVNPRSTATTGKSALIIGNPYYQDSEQDAESDQVYDSYTPNS